MAQLVINANAQARRTDVDTVTAYSSREPEGLGIARRNGGSTLEADASFVAHIMADRSIALAQMLAGTSWTTDGGLDVCTVSPFVHCDDVPISLTEAWAWAVADVLVFQRDSSDDV